jgi:hypothetical protein
VKTGDAPRTDEVHAGEIVAAPARQFSPRSDSPLFTKAEAAEFCRVSLSTFDRHVQRCLPPVRIGGRVLFHREDLLRWLDTQRRAEPGSRNFDDVADLWLADIRPVLGARARKVKRDLAARRDAELEYGAHQGGALTLSRYVKAWNAERQKLGLADAKNTEARLRDHVVPVLGDQPIAELRPRHVVDLFKRLRTDGKLAPKTIYNIYADVKALFRDAQMADLIDTSPCVLTKYQLGQNVDKNPEWRPTAIYSRDELEQLISDLRVPFDRRVYYALEGIGALRLGEAAGLRYRHYDPMKQPLGELLIATSYDKGRTKTKIPRRMPVHPTLGAFLAEWKLHGWVEMMGRAPTLNDLVVPLPPDHAARRRGDPNAEPMRSKTYVFKRLRDDLKALGLRHRRGQDLRRTMISLARTDGARKDILELCTHTPRKGSTIDLYTTFAWKALCEEVVKLRVQWKAITGSAVPLLPAAGGGPVATA